MNEICPEHIDGFVRLFESNNKYNYRNSGDFIFIYEVQCECKGDIFEIYKDSKPTVIVKCSSCGKQIIVYDLKYYPAAAAIDELRPLLKYESQFEDEVLNVCVVYEYSDEFAIQDDSFDRNCITWCVVYAYGLKSRELFEIINDETS